MDRIKKFRWWYLLILLPLVMLAGFLVWALTPLGPMPEALQALESSESVVVETEDWYVFTTRDATSDTGLIIYPGGRVDPRSYAPAAHALSAEGYHVVIVPMPLNLAVLGVNKAEEVMAAYPDIQTWVLGGHSLGGSMAANYVNANPGIIDGLVLWASYPATSDDLSMVDVSVTSISATHDGLATPADMAASKLFLPADTTWVIINGGNHAQFGWYGEQSGDNEAELSREEQQDHIIRATLELLEDVNAGN